jgi:hypothetical protein
MFKPAGFTAEGTFSPDLLIAGDHPVRTGGVTVKADKVYARGTVLYLKSGETQYEAYDGGTFAATSILAIAVDAIDTTGAAASVPVYIAGDFNANKLTFATGGTVAAIRSRALSQSIYLHDAVAA